ncbi:MAG TPA: glycerophosphodiester phosphodiesterase family protein [Actinocrinis sp.]|nr:glycerophosphodiester phosphodiesterase family protein [Actinocrinis sp.]
MTALGHPIQALDSLPTAAGFFAAIPHQGSASSGCRIPPVIAHRGEGGNPDAFPENTSWSEVDAARHGAGILNVDVRWTADGVPVALHDPTVDRTTSGTGPITGYTAARFTALTSRDDAGQIRAGLHPQTLAQLLAGIRATGLPIVIQMESDPLDGSDPVPAQTQFAHFAQVIAASGLSSRIVVAGWTAPDLLAFRAAAPSVPTAFLQDAGDPPPSAVLATGARILYLQYTGMTAAEVAGWHRAGLVVWAWTPPSSAEWSSLSRDRVDAIATNWVPAYARWAGGGCSSVRGG